MTNACNCESSNLAIAKDFVHKMISISYHYHHDDIKLLKIYYE